MRNVRLKFLKTLTILLPFWAMSTIFSVQLLYFFHQPPNFFDEGIWLEFIHKVIDGGKPYIDFPTDYGPFYLAYLASVLRALGGKLIHLRIWMGLIQGLACFAILTWVLRKLIGKASFWLACLVALTAANPTTDATMYWGIRYYIALLWIAPISLDIINISENRPNFLSFRGRLILVFSYGFLFFFSGEAGAYVGPILFIYLIFLLLKKKLTYLEGFLFCACGFLGLALTWLYLGNIALLYCKHLFITAPHIYNSVLLKYPPFGLSTFNYYFPFIILVFGVITAILKRKTRWGFLASCICLLISLKVSTTRADSVHLSYCYPFVLLQVGLLFKTWTGNRPLYKVIQTLLIASTTCSLLLFHSIGEFRDYLVQAKVSLFRPTSVVMNHNWGILQDTSDYLRLKSAQLILQQHGITSQSRVLVLPFQQILYSGLHLSLLTTETMKSCSVSSDRSFCSHCSSSFIGTNPDSVIWIPEGSMYSWPYDGFYAGFEYPEAFQKLSVEFSSPISLGSTGWFLFQKLTGKIHTNSRQDFKTIHLSEWAPCDTSLSQCGFLDVTAGFLKMQPQKELDCKRPQEKDIKNLIKSLGGEIPMIQINNSKPLWACRNSGQVDCLCSRIRDYGPDSKIFTRWSWHGLMSPTEANLSRFTIWSSRFKN